MVTKITAVSKLEEHNVQLCNRCNSVGTGAGSEFMYRFVYFTLVFFESMESGVTRDGHFLAAFVTLM